MAASVGPGDQVLCHIKNKKIASAYDADYDYKITFDVISIYNEGYLLYVPLDMYLDEMIGITAANHVKYNVDKRFIGSNACHVSDFKIIKVCDRADGMHCSKCNEFYKYAQANQENGTLVCWSCKKYPFYL